ncbi:MAG: peptide chain release factor N(5)-glutamine methyltransferase, partial [Patescibacteria group bacterium]
ALLAFVIKKPKEYLYAHPEAELTPNQQKLFQKLIARRGKHEPVAYLTGHKEFFGLDFIVNHNVLIPRPETELLVEEAIKRIKNYELRIKNCRTVLIDIGTGSGCIPIAIVKNSGVRAIAIDMSSAALKIARKNARQYGILDSPAKIFARRKLRRGNDKEEGGNDKRMMRFIKGDLLKNTKYKIQNTKFLIITANLPYLPTSEWHSTMPDVKKYEPRLALDGGPDGLKYYRKLMPQIAALAKKIPKTKIVCLFEFCPEEKTALEKLVHRYFPNPSLEPFTGRFKPLCEGRRLKNPSANPLSLPLLKGEMTGAGRTNAVIEIKKDLAGRDRLMLVQISPSP